MHIAVIGAGLSGLTCARHLQACGHHVTVYEKSYVVSGRSSTRRTELGGFDHGAQYFTTRSAVLKKTVATWLKAGWVAPWQGKLVTLQNGKTAPAAQSTKGKAIRYVGIPGMRTLGEQLAQGLDVRTGQRVERVERDGQHWLLTVHAETVPIAATAGPFDAVVAAVPADQAIALLASLPAFAAAAEQAKLAPCWTLLLAFQQELGLGYDGAWVNQSRLAWLARDGSKPGRRPGEHWVANASTAWSIEHLEDDAERVKEKLIKAFHDATASQIQPLTASVHRWRYAQSMQPLPNDCLWDVGTNLGACGDWFSAGMTGSGKIENAYLSGLALAAAIGS